MEQTVRLQIELLEQETNAWLQAADAVALRDAEHQSNETRAIQGRVGLGRHAPGNGRFRLDSRVWPSPGVLPAQPGAIRRKSEVARFHGHVVSHFAFTSQLGLEERQ